MRLSISIMLLYLFFLSFYCFPQTSDIYIYKVYLFRHLDDMITQEVSVEVSIYKGTVKGEVAFSESHNLHTNIIGALNIPVGSKESVKDIEWTDKNYFIEVIVKDQFKIVKKIKTDSFVEHIYSSKDDITLGYDNSEKVLYLNDFLKEININDYFICGEKIYYEGQYYATVKFGNQCWFAENINIGSYIDSRYKQGRDCNDIRKHCFKNEIDNCDVFGGLYSWSQAMCGESNERTQGICPDGWYIPNHDDWTTLEKYICKDLGNINCNEEFPYDIKTHGLRGKDEGYMLKSNYGWDTIYGTTIPDKYGFSAIPGSASKPNGSFYKLGTNTSWWSSTGYERGICSVAWYRNISNFNSGILRTSGGSLGTGRAVRCVRNIDEL